MNVVTESNEIIRKPWTSILQLGSIGYWEVTHDDLIVYLSTRCTRYQWLNRMVAPLLKQKILRG